MATDSFGTQWSWPGFMNTDGHDAEDDGQTRRGTQGESPESQPQPQPQQQRRRHYPPRTCRICLEVCQPTTEIDSSIPNMFAGKAKVRYYSEDPELGRLISPCKCKGSQKYVHEGCLQMWRAASPLHDRNFWSCPTCKFKYSIERLSWSKWLSSKVTRAFLTVLILVMAVFLLGFVADPIINLWNDPLGTFADSLFETDDLPPLAREYGDRSAGSWAFHFVKGFFSLGLLGFLKTFFAMSPLGMLQVRLNAGGRRRRDRVDSVNMYYVMIGVVTFLVATWKVVNHLTKRALERASERVVDIQSDEPDDEEYDDGAPGAAEPPDETKKDL